KEVLRQVECPHCCATQFVFRQEVWLIVLHEWKQPVAAASPFSHGFSRERRIREYGLTEPFPIRRETDIALNRFAVGSRPGVRIISSPQRSRSKNFLSPPQKDF